MKLKERNEIKEQNRRRNPLLLEECLLVPIVSGSKILFTVMMEFSLSLSVLRVFSNFIPSERASSATFRPKSNVQNDSTHLCHLY